MKGIKEAFIDAGEISQMLGIGMTKAYAIIKEYNAELEAKGYFTMRGKLLFGKLDDAFDVTLNATILC